MRISLVVLFCLFIVVVNSATSKTTPRHVVTTARHGTTKAPARKSAYAYLRTVRGKNSCANGSCPFWDGHGRSFVSLRCYAEQYKDCTCLHRMCFRSCLFTPAECNAEMVQCLKEICPRCLPASSVAMCSIYDSVAERVALSLSAFACYSCCPIRFPINHIPKPSVVVITPIKDNAVVLLGSAPATGVVRLPNGVPQNAGTGPVNGGNRPVNGGTGPANGGNRPVNGGTGPVNGGNRPVNGGTGPVNGGNRPVNGGTGPVNGGNRPVNGGTSSVNGGVNRPNTGNQGNTKNPSVVSSGNGQPNKNNNGANKNKPVQKTVRPAVRIVTTRRTSATTRRATTVSGNKIKNTVRTTAKSQKKPQTNNLIKN